MKFSVLPESAERAINAMGMLGSSMTGLSAAIAGYCQERMSPLKFRAMVAASRLSSLIPGRLNATVIGEI